MSSFSDYDLKPTLLTTLAAMGFEKPSPIQEAAIPLLKSFEKDFIGLAPTGTGKTAAFALPLLNNLADHKTKGLQALILCPTRELALQVATQINKLGQGLGLRAQAVYGGAGYAEQIRALKSGVPIIVGTPGRILDHMRSGNLKLEGLKALVLDEADEMISMGFQEDIETVLKEIPAGQSRLWLFSATMSPEIRRIADRYLTKPDLIVLNQVNKIPTELEQIYYVTREGNKAEVLGKLIEDAGEFYGLIFCQTKALVVDLTQQLVDQGYKADNLHGDKSQDARERTLKSFRERKLQILVCTDVASRGIDVKDITHVVNYSLPRELENYIHRIGRTARSGKKGIALSLVTPSHRALVGRIEKRTGVRMKEGVIPSSRMLKEKKLAKLLERFQSIETHDEGMARVRSTWAEAIKEMTREEIAARLLALISPELLQPTPAAPPPEMRDSRDSYDRGGPRRSGGRDGGGYPARRPFRASGAPSRGPSSKPSYNSARGERPSRPTERPVRSEERSAERSDDRPTRSESRPLRSEGRSVKFEGRPEVTADTRSESRPAKRFDAEKRAPRSFAAEASTESRPRRFTPGAGRTGPGSSERRRPAGVDSFRASRAETSFREQSKARRKNAQA